MNACNCSNNGQCVMDNETLIYSCVCSQCTGGKFCENIYYYVEYSMLSSVSINILWEDSISTRTALKILIIFVFSVLTMLALISNFLAVLTCSVKKIRVTTCGIYIIFYSISGFIGVIMLEFLAVVALFYNDELKNYSLVHCSIVPACVNVISDLCLWLSAFIAAERVLIEFFHFSLYRSRKYAVIYLVILLMFLGFVGVLRGFGRNTSPSPIDPTYPVCSFHQFSYSRLKAAYDVVGSLYSHFVIPLVLSVLSIIITLFHIIRRKINLNDVQRNSRQSLIIQQIMKHKDFFIPPIVNIICTLPEKIFIEVAGKYCLEKSKQKVYLRLHIALDFLLFTPLVVSFLIYIYPSKVYMSIFNDMEIIKRIRRISCRKSFGTKQLLNDDQVFEETIF